MKIQGLFFYFPKNKYSTFFKIIKSYIKLVFSRNKFRTIFYFLFFTKVKHSYSFFSKTKKFLVLSQTCDMHF